MTVQDAIDRFSRRVKSGEFNGRPERPARRRKSKIGVPTEADEQKAVVGFLRAHGLDFFAVPNEGRRSVYEMAAMRARGFRAGVFDLVVLNAADNDRPVFVEMKRSAGGRLSEAQRKFGETLDRLGYQWVVAHGADEAIAWLKGVYGL